MPTIPNGVKAIDLSQEVRAAQMAAEQRQEIAARARRVWQGLQAQRAQAASLAGQGGGGNTNATVLPPGAGGYEVTPALGERDFGPGLPLKPRFVPGSNEVDGGPRLYQYPVSSNIITQPRREDARLTPFEQLANLVELYDVAQIAIATRIEQVQGMEHQIVAKNKREQAARQDECDEVAEFFKKPDGVTDFGSWIGSSIRDHLVFDAVTFFPHPDKSGDLHSLDIIHGPTIKPLLDDRGRVMAYQQVLWGYPFSDFRRDIMRPDGEYDDLPTFSPNDLMYKPRYTRTWTPYGSPPAEWIILRVNQALRKQYSDLAWFQDGNIPEMLVTLSDPSGRMTPEQVEAFERWFNAVMSGDDAERRKMRFIPYGTDVKELRPFSYTTELDLWMLQITCAAFSVPPQELGFTQDVNRATAELQEAVNERRGLKPLTKWYKDIFDDIIQRRLGVGWRNRKKNASISRPGATTKQLKYAYDGLVWQWSFGDKTDQNTVANTYQTYISAGVLSADEVRAMVFSDQVEGPSPETRKAQAEEAKAAQEAEAAASAPPAPLAGPGGAEPGAEEGGEAGGAEAEAAPAGGPPGGAEAGAEEAAGAETELAVSASGEGEPGVEERLVVPATPRRPRYVPALAPAPRRSEDEVELDLGSNLRQLARQKVAKSAAARRQFFDPSTLSDILFGQLYKDVALANASQAALYVTKREGWSFDRDQQDAEVVTWLKKHAEASAREIIEHLSRLKYDGDLISGQIGSMGKMLDEYAQREVAWAASYPHLRAVYTANVMKGVSGVFGNAAIVPPIHKRCFLPGTTLLVPGKTAATAKAFYSGLCVEVRLSNGNVLTVTANHPILTMLGYVDAQSIKKGDKVYRAIDGQGIVDAINPYDNNVPSLVEEIVGAFEKSIDVERSRVPASAVDFHGDGRRMHGDVDVVWANGLLRGELDASLSEPTGQQQLGGIRHGIARLAGDGSLRQPLGGLWLPAHGGMGGLDHVGALAGSAFGPSGEHPFGSPANGHTGILESLGEEVAADAALASEFLHRFAGQVTLDEVVEVRHFDYSGHVYSLDVDPYHVVIGNGIVTSNCRCRCRGRRIYWKGDEEALNDAGDQQIFYAAQAVMRKADDPNHVYIGVWITREDEKVCKKPFRTPFGTVMGCKSLNGVCVTKGPFLGKQAPPTA